MKYENQNALENQILALENREICDRILFEDCKQYLKSPRIKIHFNDRKFYPEKNSLAQFETQKYNHKNQIRNFKDFKNSLLIDQKNIESCILDLKSRINEINYEIKLVLKDKSETFAEKKKIEEEYPLSKV